MCDLLKQIFVVQAGLPGAGNEIMPNDHPEKCEKCEKCLTNIKKSQTATLLEQ